MEVTPPVKVIKIGKKLLNVVCRGSEKTACATKSTTAPANKVSGKMVQLSQDAFEKEGLCVREAKTIRERAKVYRTVIGGIYDSAKGVCYSAFDAWASKMEEYLYSPLTVMFKKNLDLVGVYDKSGKCVGGLIGDNKPFTYYIDGLYIEPAYQRKKSVFAIFDNITKQIVANAQKNGKHTISCDVLKKRPFLQKLYERLGFRVERGLGDSSEHFNYLWVSTKDFGKGR